MSKCSKAEGCCRFNLLMYDRGLAVDGSCDGPTSKPSGKLGEIETSVSSFVQPHGCEIVPIGFTHPQPGRAFPHFQFEVVVDFCSALMKFRLTIAERWICTKELGSCGVRSIKEVLISPSTSVATTLVYLVSDSKHMTSSMWTSPHRLATSR